MKKDKEKIIEKAFVHANTRVVEEQERKDKIAIKEKRKDLVNDV